MYGDIMPSRDFCHDQLKVALSLARASGREHREAFIRLALHWRAIAHAASIEMVEAA